MAKFRSGNLVLTSTQTIIQGNYTILDSTRKGTFSSLDLDSTGAIITEFSIDGTLAGNSDAALPTEKAVKTYVTAGLAGLSQNKISQLDSKVEVTDTGTGTVTIATDNVNKVVISGTDIRFGVGTITYPTTPIGAYANLIFKGYNEMRMTMNDGNGNFNHYLSSYFDGSVSKYLSAGTPACNFKMTAGTIEFHTAPAGVNAGDTITWNTALTMDTGGIVSIRKALTIPGTTKAAGYLYAGETDPTNATRLNYDGYFYATRVYNAVWNDIADFQDLAEPAFYAGKCYYDTIEGAKVCTERCQKSVIGVASDTFGYGVGQDSSRTQVSIAVCGWVLAHVNDATSCVPGDVLTNDVDGNLVKMTDQEKSLYPERIVAIYKRKENNEFFGPNDQVVVDGRHWVKVK
jgi:hypothetical protein